MGDKDSPVRSNATARTVPPQNLDAEESVLGAMMLSPGAIAAVSEILSSDGREFYRESHAKIYRAALALYAKGEPVDAITLVDETRRARRPRGRRRQGAHPRARRPRPRRRANAGHYAQIVHESATLRGLIRAGGEIARLGWERPGDTTELVDQAEQIVFDLSPAAGHAASSATSRSSSRRASSASPRSTSRAPTSRVSPPASATSTA